MTILADLSGINTPSVHLLPQRCASKAQGLLARVTDEPQIVSLYWRERDTR